MTKHIRDKGKALGYRPDGHAFKPCHRHIRYSTMVNQLK